jgi:alpha-D-xyloside xylohydrolase
MTSVGSGGGSVSANPPINIGGSAGGSGTAAEPLGGTASVSKGGSSGRAGTVSAPHSGGAHLSAATDAGGASASSAVRAGGSNAGGAPNAVGGSSFGGVAGGGARSLDCSAPPTSSAYQVDSAGVTFTVGSGKLRLKVCKEDIIRVEYTGAASIPAKASLSVAANWGAVPFCVSESGGTVTITTTRIKAKVVISTGIVSYTDLNDTVILAESSKSTTAATVEGTSTNKLRTVFASPSSEALYGLGQHQDGNMNLKGKSVHLLNANTQINIPVLVSNRGYGVFWDNYSSSDFSSNTSSFSYTSEAGEMVDYYFFYGPSIDQVIALYRTTTGAAPLFPKWAYGLFQSKDHYSKQTEVLNIANNYRKNNIPVDVVVQDWNYWDPYSWGSHVMDPSRYANPATMLTTLHAANIHGMISIWPLYQYMANPPSATDQDNYKALDAIGALYPSGGSHHFYDTFNAEARTLVYQQIYDRLLGKYDWDGIWADNTEPQAYPDSINPNGNGMRGVTTALGKGALVINAYPLQHNRALYEGWRKVGPSAKRVYILTRSAFAGQQRYSAAVWSGDINADLATYVKQIPAGLNYALAGMPYWTTDIGGYFGTPTEEVFTRWFQFGAFCSQFRIHGQATKELYGDQWSATGKANLLAIDQLHYRLMPYVYSLAAKVTNEGYTMMRHLVFDYPNDTKVLDIKDQFMFGPAILVNPVITTGATSRSVYLPAGNWYDFWTGSPVTGNATINANAPLSQIPLYVRAGSIVPMGPMIQYATESADPLEIRVYKGRDASFTLYEDEGDTYAYETGKSSRITFTWSETTQALSIGARTGAFPGMLATRTFNIVFVGATHGNGLSVTAAADESVKYEGTAITVNAK